MHTKILKTFYHNFPDLIDDMKNSDHHYNFNNLNPYHVEGDVWSHTMMVYSQAVKSGASIEVLFAALLHDVGKPSARGILEDKKRVHFRGHEGLSFYKAIDVLNHSCYDFLELHITNKHTILKLIALHSELFTWKQSNKSDIRFKNDQAFLNKLCEVVENDYRGRLSLDPLHPNQTWKNIIKNDFTDVRIKPLDNQKTITLLVGPPCSGKSTYINSHKMRGTRISRDDIVLELGAQDTYNECWNIVDQKEVDKVLMQQYQTALKNGEDIIIDMTNMSKKSRRKWLNDSKVNKQGYWKKAIVMCTGHDVILKRAEEQMHTKNIPIPVLENMMKRFCFPMYDEVDDIVSFSSSL